MQEYVCNYALIRFLPNRESGEFVNIGVALVCAQAGYLDFVLEKKRFARITHFFPDLSLSVYRDGLQVLADECSRRHETAERLSRDQPHKVEAILRHTFEELTRTRESVFHFSAPRTVLAKEPSAKLSELFEYYVRRPFSTDEVKEDALRHQIA